ncbi:MAG: domain protein beta Propeller [Bryobacterales bacterium]|nr:domain protein beta Propeller [Bryobacterales bacterium]
MRFLIIAVTTLSFLWAARPPRKISFARAGGVVPGALQLFVSASDGSDEHPLFAAAQDDYDPVWAPDGQSIVFTSDRNGSADLFSVNADGSGLTALTSDASYEDQAAFSPDGKKLVFVSTRGSGYSDLWTLDVATKRAKALTSGPGGDYRPAWSPDGKWIAFSSGRGITAPFAEGRWERQQLAEIYLIHPDGSGMRKVTTAGGFCGSPRWLNDSQHVLAYCSTAQQTMQLRRSAPEPGSESRLVSIDMTTGQLTDIHAGPGVKMNPSPLSGNDVGYIRKDTAEAGIVYASGRRGPSGTIRAASWSPDGKRVAFSRRKTPPLPPLVKMFSRNPNYELNLSGALPAFSPSGKQYLTMGAVPGTKVVALKVNTPETGKSDVLYQDKTRNAFVGGWSPRGDKVAFALGGFAAFFDGFRSEFRKPGDRVEGGAQIALLNTDGSAFQELTSGDDNNAFPSWSPDGNRLVFRTFGKNGQGLRIMNLETKAVTTLTSDYDNFPLWSPRGDLIMFARQIVGAYDIFTIKPDGTALKRLTNGKGNDAHMSWSFDGESIAFCSSRMGFKDEAAYTDAPQPYGEIFVMRYDGTHVEQLTDNQWEEGTPGWQPVIPGLVAHR